MNFVETLNDYFFIIGCGASIIFALVYIKFVVGKQRPKAKKTIKTESQRTMQKTRKRGRTQEFLGFEDIQDGIIILPNGRYRLVVEAMGVVNFPLLSDGEQDRVEDTFAAFLASLSTMRTPIQMYIQSRKLDLYPQIEIIEKNQKNLPAEIQDFADYHKQYLVQWMRRAPFITKRYIVIPYDAPEGETFERAHQELVRKMRSMERQMGSMLKLRQLSTDELAELFYAMYNKSKTTDQRLEDAFTNNFMNMVVRGVPFDEVRQTFRQKSHE